MEEGKAKALAKIKELTTERTGHLEHSKRSDALIVEQIQQLKQLEPINPLLPVQPLEQLPSGHRILHP